MQCPYCKAIVSNNAVRCPQCGEMLVNNPVPPRGAQSSAEYRTEQWKRPADQNYRPADQAYRPVDQRPRPKNHLVGAILVTIFCCQIFGIVSIVFAAQVDSAYNRGDIEESYRLSQRAQTWFNVAIISGIAFLIIYVVMMLLGFASSGLFYNLFE